MEQKKKKKTGKKRYGTGYGHQNYTQNVGNILKLITQMSIYKDQNHWIKKNLKVMNETNTELD